jgi:TolB protein
MGILLTLVAVLILASPVAAAVQGGTGPDDALAPAAEWQPLQPGGSHWYAFEYAGDGSQVEIQMGVEPEGGAGFAVWTPEAIRDWGLGLEAESIGRGSPDPSAPGSLLWIGSFNTAGTYYAVVEHTGDQPGTSYYLLGVSGPGVSFVSPAPASAQQPGGSKPKAAAPGQPSGKLVFQTTYGGPFYTINVDGSSLRRITDGIDPTWSPDGTEIAFTRWREPRGVWVVDAGGGTEWRAFDWDEARWPSWSPQGDHLLFSRQYGGRTEDVERCFWRWCFTLPAHPHWKLGIVRTADSYFYEPPSSDFSLAPDWSPAGDHIVYNDEHGLRVQSDDGAVSYLITHDAPDTSPAWSPNGQQVAFVRRQHDHWEIYVVDADGRNLRRLTDTPRKPDGTVGNSVAAAWSPTGAHIAYLTDRGGRWEIWVMRADGSQQRPMFDGALDGLTLDYAFVSERAISWTD